MKYFAYGSNMNKSHMQNMCGGAVSIGKYTLPGYRLVFRGVADMVEDPNNSVTGVLWEVHKDDERQLDGYEGYPLLYDKRYHEGILFYQMTFAREKRAPSKYYLSMIAEGMRDFGITIEEMMRNLGADEATIESQIASIGDQITWQD